MMRLQYNGDGTWSVVICEQIAATGLTFGQADRILREAQQDAQR